MTSRLTGADDRLARVDLPRPGREPPATASALCSTVRRPAPSGATARSTCSGRGCSGEPERSRTSAAKSQVCTWSSSSRDAEGQTVIRWPSPSNAMVTTSPGWLSGLPTGLPDPASQSRSCPVSPPGHDERPFGVECGVDHVADRVVPRWGSPEVRSRRPRSAPAVGVNGHGAAAFTVEGGVDDGFGDSSPSPERRPDRSSILHLEDPHLAPTSPATSRLPSGLKAIRIAVLSVS